MPRKLEKVARSAKTGQYVTKGFAKRHPSTTVMETRRPARRRGTR